MRLATMAQAAELDRRTSQEFGIPAELLMESAGALSAREILRAFPDELRRGGALVVCGPGNNGADGLVVARHLASAGVRRVRLVLSGDEAKRTPLLATQLARARSFGLEQIGLAAASAREGVIVDALIGVGLRGAVREPFAEAIHFINAQRAPVIALDAPSGLNLDTGHPGGVAVRARLTLTYGLSKIGLHIAQGPAYVGKTVVLPVGFAPEAMREVAHTHRLYRARDASRALPPRRAGSNKSSHGRLLVLAGRPGFWGAGVLASASAFRAGAGYVTWASFTAPTPELRQVPEVLTAAIDDRLLDGKFDAIAIGPGLGTEEATADVLRALKARGGRIPVVADADALTVINKFKIGPLPEHWILTPHSGELGRLLGRSAEAVEADRAGAAVEASHKLGAHVVLKGFHTVIASGDRVRVINAGNAALAKAGTGDVLTGFIGAWLAQGLAPLEAASLGAFVHGHLADTWVRDGFDPASLNASDLSLHFPRALATLRKARA